MTQPGFWRSIRSDNRDLGISSNRLGGIGKTWFIFPQGSGPRGSFSTFTDLKPNLRSRDVIILGGVLREQAVCPVGVYDVSVIGAANQFRQSTNGGVPTGGGASWLAPTTPVAATPLLRIIEQGWSFENIQFAPVAASACLTFDRRETAIIPDASHAIVSGCYFSTGGANGIGIEGIEVKKLMIMDNVFEALTGATGAAIKTTAGSGIAAPSHWTIHGNKFVQCINDINCPSMNWAQVHENIFYSTNPIEGGIRIKLDGSSGRNRVINNRFSDVIADVTIAKGYTPATSDIWSNWAANSTVLIATVPT